MAGVAAHATYGAPVSADEPQYLLTAISLGHDGNLDISDELAGEDYWSFHPRTLDPQTYALDAGGQQLSPHDPLLPAVLALPVRVAGWRAAKVTLALCAGALASLTAWVAIRRFGVRPGVALSVVAVFSCTAPLATYATQVYPEIPAAFAVMAVVAAATGGLRTRGLAVATVALVALPWLSVKYVPVAAALGASMLWQLRRRPRTALVVAALVGLLGVVYLVAHHRIYGGWTAYATGDHFEQTGEFSVIGTSPNYLGRSRRLVGLLVDRGFGLAAWMPGWLLLPVALGAIARRRPRHWPVLAIPVAAGWFVATFVALTMHGWWWPGRQVVVILPVVVVAFAWVVDRVPAVRVPLAVATVIGVLTWWWTTIEAITMRHVLIVDFEQTANPWYRLWHHLLPDGRSPHIGDDLLTTLWWLVVVGLAVAGWRAARGADDGAVSSTRPASATPSRAAVPTATIASGAATPPGA
jgi:hypothetical protein